MGTLVLSPTATSRGQRDLLSSGDQAGLVPRTAPSRYWSWGLTRPVAAVDVKRLLRDVVRFGGGEKDRHPGDIFRLLDPPQRNRGNGPPLRLADRQIQQLREPAVNLLPGRGVHHARRDAVDVDLVLDQ